MSWNGEATPTIELRFVYRPVRGMTRNTWPRVLQQKWRVVDLSLPSTWDNPLQLRDEWRDVPAVYEDKVG